MGGAILQFDFILSTLTLLTDDLSNDAGGSENAVLRRISRWIKYINI